MQQGCPIAITEVCSYNFNSIVKADIKSRNLQVKKKFQSQIRSIEKLIVAYLAKKFSTFYRTRIFITYVLKICQWALSLARRIHFKPLPTSNLLL